MTAPRKRDKADFEAAKADAQAARPSGPPRLDYEQEKRRAEALRQKTFAPLKWIVPGILPEGLTMLGGRPKVGKSWTALDACVAVESGGTFMGEKCERGDVLGLFLEDSDRRMQRRLTKMLGAQKEPWPDFTYYTRWPRLHDGGIDWMRRWIDDSKRPRLIVVDILQKVRQPKGNSRDSQYEADYEALMSMQALASEAQIAIVVLHHQRKMKADDLIDTMSGTLGLTGGVDHLLILGKDADGSRFLWGNGRECEEFDYRVRFDDHMRLQNLGARTADAASAERMAIIGALAKAERSMSIVEITKAVGGVRDNVKNLLSKMTLAGAVEREAMGRYRLPKSPI